MMTFEVIDIYTKEVECQFNEEYEAWDWIRSQGDHADRYDVVEYENGVKVQYL